MSKDKQKPEKSKEVAQTENRLPTLKESLVGKLTQLKTLLPPQISPERFMRIVFLQVQRNPTLANATQESIVASVMRAAEHGLIPDGRGGALVPFRNNQKGVMECQFIPMYQGLIDLARRSGQIADIFPATVRENDEFEFELGLNRKLVHKPAIKDRGEAILYYAVVQFTDGTTTFGPGPMTPEEIDAIKARSKAKNNGPWKTDYEAMAWKTVIKRVLKFCPASVELQQAIQESDEIEFESMEIDITPDAGSADALNASLSGGDQNEEAVDVDTDTGEIKETGSDGAPVVTFAELAEKINEAKTTDDVDLVSDLIGQIEDEKQQAELSEMAEAKIKELLK